MKQSTFILALFFIGMISAIFNTIQDVCQKSTEKFTLYKNKEVIDFNVGYQFQKGIYVGNGAFGEVRAVLFGFNGIEKVGIKRVLRSKINLPEFDVLATFSPLGVGPTFYGCQYDTNYVFVVQTLLYKDLDSLFIVTKLKALKNSQFLERMKEIFVDLRTMWNKNYIHNDLKGANIMIDENLSKLTLIDFGLATLANQRLRTRGTPMYMSPRKWTADLKMPIPLDDIYSIGIMIAVLLGRDGEQSMQVSVPYGEKIIEITKRCFKGEFDASCTYVYKENSKKILTEANFGNYHRSPELRKKETINFTTFVAMIVGFKDFPFNYDDCIFILERLISHFQKIESAGIDNYISTEDLSLYTDPNDLIDRFRFGRKYQMIKSDNVDVYEMDVQEANTIEAERLEKLAEVERLRLEQEKLEQELKEKREQQKKETEEAEIRRRNEIKILNEQARIKKEEEQKVEREREHQAFLKRKKEVADRQQAFEKIKNQAHLDFKKIVQSEKMETQQDDESRQNRRNNLSLKTDEKKTQDQFLKPPTNALSVFQRLAPAKRIYHNQPKIQASGIKNWGLPPKHKTLRQALDEAKLCRQNLQELDNVLFTVNPSGPPTFLIPAELSDDDLKAYRARMGKQLSEYYTQIAKNAPIKKTVYVHEIPMMGFRQAKVDRRVVNIPSRANQRVGPINVNTPKQYI